MELNNIRNIVRKQAVALGPHYLQRNETKTIFNKAKMIDMGGKVI